MDFDNFVGVAQTVSEGTFQMLVTLLLITILTGVGSGDMYHTDNWKWKFSGCSVHGFGHFQLSMTFDIIVTLIFKIGSSRISDGF